MLHKTLLFALFLFVFSLSSLSQIPPTKEDNDIVKITTSLIQLDVTVTDSKNSPIKDLKPDEIEVYENGKKQEVTNFSFVSNNKKNGLVDNQSPSIPYIPSKVRPEQVKRTIALVVDDLTLSFSSVHAVRDVLRKFINEQMEDGDLVAIIRTGIGVGALQQFTSNKQQLLAAANSIKFNLSGQVSIGKFNYEGFREKSEIRELQENVFTSGTLGALNFVVKGMKELPGRKSVILLSDGLRLFNRDDSGKPQQSPLANSLRHLIDFANRSSVVFYTIDANGLLAPGGAEIGESSSLSLQTISDLQDGLRYLARETGGFAIVNQNNISKGVARVLDDQSYYLIAYQPDEKTFDATNSRFNKIEIKVKREGAKVRYRSGFFGISDDKISKPNRSPLQTIINAITSPFGVNDIALNLNTIFVADEKQKTFLKSYLHIKGDNLHFVRQVDGSYKAVFDIVALSYGENGVIIDEFSQTFTMSVKEDSYQKIAEKGFVYYFTFPVKKPGAYQLRVAVRDTVTNKIGSANQFIEVPNLKKKRLTVSGIVLENLTDEQYERISKENKSYEEIRNETDPPTDTALRKFKSGTVLRFGYDIYNAQVAGSLKPNLTAQFNIYQDGKLYFAAQPSSLNFSQHQLQQGIFSKVGRLKITKDMPLGEYIFQIVVTDLNRTDKNRIAVQWFDFEVTN